LGTDREAIVKRVRIPGAALAAVGVLAALTLAIGFAHTKAGRPLLSWVARAASGHASACPFGYGRAASPEEREAARARFAASHKGSMLSSSRPALGFVLDRTTRGDVLAWASVHRVSCTPGRGIGDLNCPDVRDELVPEAFRAVGSQELWFVFGSGERLISVTAAAHSPRPEAISAAFTSVVTTLDRQAGAPSRVEGNASAERLSSGPLYQASAEYRFGDYYAIARATNVGPGGYALTAEYRSLPN
jgi:hypothetical protein